MTVGELIELLTDVPDNAVILARVDGSIYPISSQETADYNADPEPGQFFLYVDVA
jgi:hypothetical protein